MTYEEIVEIISSKRRFGKAPGCEVTGALLEAADHPDQGQKIVHIAGTNGKGSVAAFLTAIIKSAGFKVGTFTSPHLIDFCERIAINGDHISRENVVRLGQKALEIEAEAKAQATMFDLCLLMALEYFKEEKVDYIILETGLGGRLDSTNGLSQKPQVSVITSIGLDHTSILGDSLEEIAKEKAGIIKENVPLVLGIIEDGPKQEIIKLAKEKNAKVKEILEGADCNYKLSLLGVHQKGNALVAKEAFLHLVEKDRMSFLEKYFSLIKSEETEEACGAGSGCNGICSSCGLHQSGSFEDWVEQCIKKGLEGATWIGRMQKVDENPLTFVDGAHNPQGVEALSKSLRDEFEDKKHVFFMGAMADKDYKTMIEEIKDICETIYVCAMENDRAATPKMLEDAANGAGLKVVAISDMNYALKAAKEEALAKKEILVIFGSLYFVGDILKLYKSKKIV